MLIVCGDNEKAKYSVLFRMVKREMWDEYLFGPVCDLGDKIFPCFSVLPHWETWDSSPVGGWRGWHYLCWPTDLCSSLVNQDSEKIPVGKIIFHKGKASLSAAHFSNLVFCAVRSWIGLCRWRGSCLGSRLGPLQGRCAADPWARCEDGCVWLTWCGSVFGVTANGAAPLPSYPHLLSQCDLLVTVPHGWEVCQEGKML